MLTIALTIPPRLGHLISPDVLRTVEDRIAEREAAEADSPFLYKQYLAAHADHIYEEVVRRDRVSTEEPGSPPELGQAA